MTTSVLDDPLSAHPDSSSEAVPPLRAIVGDGVAPAKDRM
jgi:hypothetical protein